MLKSGDRGLDGCDPSPLIYLRWGQLVRYLHAQQRAIYLHGAAIYLHEIPVHLHECRAATLP